mgnify:CR=1 FL=1
MSKSYLDQILEAISAAGKGKLIAVNVLHDDGCKKMKGTGDCNCEPEVKLEDLNEETK